MKPTKKPPREKLPKEHRGASVVRGLGMNHEKLEKLFEKKALGQFDAKTDLYIVVDDQVLEDRYKLCAFREKKDAIRYAQALGNGNVDHRVLRVTEQTLVVATENDL